MDSRAYGIRANSHVPFLSHRGIRILVGCILIITLCAPLVGATHITQNTFFAKWTFDDNEQFFPSSPSSTFDSSDPWICSYVLMENTQAPFSVTWKFYSPSGIFYFYETTDHNWTGDGYSSIIEPTSLFFFEPGKWRMDVEYNGTVELSDTFYVVADPVYPVGIENPAAASSNLHIYRIFLFANFTIQEGAFSPRDPRTQFTDADHWIVPYVLLKDIQPSDTLTWEFYTPDNTLEYTSTLPSPEAGLLTGYDEYHMPVAQFIHEPGIWRVVVRYNGQEEASRSFSVQTGPPYQASAAPTSSASPTNAIKQSPDQGNPFLIPGLAGAGILILCIAGAVVIRRRQIHQGVPSQPPVKITPSAIPSLNIPHDVFICYSSDDKPIADAICARLEAKGIRCWIAPRDVLPGLPYQQALITAIDTSRILVMVFSSSANDSPHVLRELSRAVDKNVIIIPFRIEDVQPSNALAYILSVPHWLDAINPPLEKHIEELGNTIMILLENEKKKQKTD